MAGYLLGEEGPFTGLVISLETGDEWIVGRDPSLVFQVLEDPMVSRKHVLFRKTDEGYTIENLSVVNPTELNHKELDEPTLLREGDLVQIGNSNFRFSLEDPRKKPELLPTSEPKEDVSFTEDFSSRWMIKVIGGPNNGAEIGLSPGKAYIIGKDPEECDIVFQDLSVSKKHARISVSNDQEVSIEDLDSKNGVFVGGVKILETTKLEPQDTVTIGTSTFIVIDQEGMQQTIYAPAPNVPIEETSGERAASESVRDAKTDWKQLRIPRKHLLIAFFFLFLAFIGVVGTISLFRAKEVNVVTGSELQPIEEITNDYPQIRFSYTSGSGKLFIFGHLGTELEQQELLYRLSSLKFLSTLENNIIIDERVVENFNALLLKNPAWRSVTIMYTQVGRFLLRGYVETPEQLQELSDYIRRNFSYLDRLENNVVAEKTLNAQIQSLIKEKDLINVAFELKGGELVLGGTVNEKEEEIIEELVQKISELNGITQVKNLVVFTAGTSRVDLSSRYQITGTSMFGDVNQYVMINGKILGSGDYLDSMMITEITKKEVLLERDGIKYRINYNQL